MNEADRVLFKFAQYQGKTVLLMLEVIRQHAYEKSKFLRGAVVDESKIIETTTPPLTAETLTYLNPNRPYFHILDKIIAFDEPQQEIYQLPLPLVLIGSAGSGKTALTLEKIKAYSGNILYVTHSPYLVQHARQLYYAQEHDHAATEVNFLSYQELLETVHVPAGREIPFRDFSAWLSRMNRHPVLKDHHKLFEEFKGVLTGTVIDRPYLSRIDYLALGVKQSIYLTEERDFVYDLFEKYLALLKTQGYYDLNLLSHHYLSQCRPQYDIIVADEIQDFTNVQLILVMKFLKNAHHFLLCGDANQIVHPNFFSWAKVKTLFYQGALGEDHAITRILYTNYRNSAAVTDIANQLLKIKNARLGSVDKESHYLIESNSSQSGSVSFLQTHHPLVKELNQNTKQSTHYAVIVIRDEYKEAAKRYFQTPLVFSIFETKGLEYDHIILFDFISAESGAFREIVQGVTAADLGADLNYRRAKEKTDKSLEIYKFYINALYVAMTRARRDIYWIESQEKHPLFDLLNLQTLKKLSLTNNSSSSAEEWQREARKLDLQGKQEQADAIRNQLNMRTVPWTVITLAVAAEMIQHLLAGDASKLMKIQVLEYAVVYQQHTLIQILAQQGLSAAQQTKKSADIIDQKYYGLYASTNLSAAHQAVKQYGVDFRNPFNQTLLMIAAQVGNGALARWLLECGTNPSLTDNAGRQAFDIVWQQALGNKRFTQTKFAALYTALAPEHISLQAEGWLIKIDQKHAEFLLYYAAKVLIQRKPAHERSQGLTSQDFTQAFQDIPESILPAYRKKRAYLSSLLSKNEMHGKNPYNRHLFKRCRLGHYVMNPVLQVKTEKGWESAYQSDIHQPSGLSTSALIPIEIERIATK